jgi:FkbM family methyltransferase
MLDEDSDQKELTAAPIGEVPWYFRLGRFLSKHKIRGGDRLLAEAGRRGLLDQLVVYSLGDIQLRVPLWRPCNQWLENDVRDYEAAFMRVLGNSVCQLSGDVTLIDCGADIGTVSAHLVSRCKNIKRVIAFEPNIAAYRVLEQNLRAMPLATDARHAAVGNFCGRGTLVRAPQDPSAHAMFIRPSAEGPIAVQRVDDLGLTGGGSCVIKIDVEGTEASVVEGAADTIRQAGEVLVAFEAHPRVAQRLGRDPIDVMHALLAIRSDFTFDVDTTPARSVFPDKPLFKQLLPTRVYNVIARSGVS